MKIINRPTPDEIGKIKYTEHYNHTRTCPICQFDRLVLMKNQLEEWKNTLKKIEK